MKFAKIDTSRLLSEVMTVELADCNYKSKICSGRDLNPSFRLERPE